MHYCTMCDMWFITELPYCGIYYIQVHKFSLQFGRTALLYASQYGHVEAVQMLLQQNADTTITDVVCTLAMEACLASAVQLIV